MHNGILFRHKKNKSPAILAPQKELGAITLSGIRQSLETNITRSLIETGKVDKAEEERVVVAVDWEGAEQGMQSELR